MGYLAAMTSQPTTAAASPAHADILVAGAGVVGLAVAIALARAGFAVTSIGPAAAPRNGRTVALLEGSVRMLRALGVWQAASAAAAPLAVMRIVDDTGSLFRTPPVDFKASEIGLAAFGHNIENADLMRALADTALRTPGLTRTEHLLERHEVAGDRILGRTGDGVVHSGRLLVAADGPGSPTRKRAHIDVREEAYPQVAVTVILHHSEPHQDISTEFHTRQGPFTLVPLPPSEGAMHRSSLVWVMSPEEASRRLGLVPAQLAAEIEAQSRFLLGSLAIEGPVGHFPLRRMVAKRLVGDRLALAGEAAHALPPIGAQGLNLSLRDAAALVDHAVQAGASGGDPGSARLLAAYERSRMGDVALRSGAVGALNRALLSSLLPVDALRGAGLLALASLPAVRRAVMRQGLMPQHGVPSLMR
jgi:2-octaprenyl-6-methoxyphenol hydroxylase